MFIKIVLGLAVILVVFLVVVALQPADFRYSRSLAIAAPPEQLFEQINDLHNFQKWNPWAKLDPNAKLEYAGPTSGVGAAYSWAGNKKIGAGSMTIIETRPKEMVRCSVAFKEPFQATNISEFTFRPEGGRTLVTWSMSGKNGFLFKGVGLFIDSDKMLGADFERGLAELKKQTEATAQN